MLLEYSIIYKTENQYANWVKNANWQFLIIPYENESQEYVDVQFKNSIDAINEYSINGYGFKTIRVRPDKEFKSISFEASFKLIKKEVNPFNFYDSLNNDEDFKTIQTLDFKVDYEPFLKSTPFTILPDISNSLFAFDPKKTLFNNIQELNEFTYKYIHFKPGVTSVNTTVQEVITKKCGVCQDFTHLFCALARQNHIPARYVSGYLHQGNGFFGDSQMHAWAEVYLPNIGWVGFDPTNNLLANTNHIKVAHGKDYNDCSPLRGIIYSGGSNITSHSVQVSSEQQQ